MLLTVLHSVWSDIRLPEALPQSFKKSSRWITTGWRSQERIFLLRIIAQPPARNIPQALLSCFISSGNQVLGDREVTSPQRGRGVPPPKGREPGVLGGPGAPQPASFPVGAKRDRGHGVLLRAPGHAALRPGGPQDFLCYLIVHDPHEHGLGRGCGVLRRGSERSVYTAARNSLFSRKEGRAVGFPVVSGRLEEVLLTGRFFPRRVPWSPQPSLWVQKKEHFLSDPGLTVQVLRHRAVLGSAAPASARPRSRRGIPGARSQGSPAPHVSRKGPGAPQAAGSVREILRPAGPRSPGAPQPGGRLIHPSALSAVHAANSR